MDYRKLIADGEYKKEDLNDVNRAFVEGIEYVAQEFDYYYSPEETEDDFSNTLTNIKREIIEKVVEDIKEYVEVIAAETTVEMLDGQEEEKVNEEIIKAIDILDRFDFFQGQRAGRELWFEKPTEVQDEDIKLFAKDVQFLKDVIAHQQTEIDRLNNKLNGMGEPAKLVPEYEEE